MDHKLELIKNIIVNTYIIYMPIVNNDSINNIYELFVNDIIFEPKDDIEMNYLGNYYKIAKNYDKMVEYYLMAINRGNDYSMHSLGLYYRNQKNYDLMIKYFLMAIDRGNKYSMNNLGIYYFGNKNYDETKKYWSMAINIGHTHSMNNLAYYHKSITKNINEMLKYYFMAIEHGDDVSLYCLGKYYKEIKNYKKMKMYHLMSINTNNIKSYKSLREHCETKILKLELRLNYQHIIPRKKIINMMDRIMDNELDNNNMNNFLQLLLNFEFNDEDNVGPHLKIMMLYNKNCNSYL